MQNNTKIINERNTNMETKCVCCDECIFRTETCLCEISENDEDCPLGLGLDIFSDCVIGLTYEKYPILSYEKMLDKIMEVEDLDMEDAICYLDFNVIRQYDYNKSKAIIMYEL